MRKTKKRKPNKQLHNYMRLAIKAGCTRDQLDLFVQAGYIAQPIQLKMHALAREADHEQGPLWIGFGGARGVSKSHGMMAQVGLDDCQRWSGLKILFLRKIQSSAAESLEDLSYRIFRRIRHVFTKSPGRILFPDNGSRIIIGGYNNERDIDKYLGIEYDGAVVEEITQLSENKIIKLRGSIRSSIPGYRARIYNSTNPGGIGHLWYVENFVNPEKKKLDHMFLGGRTRFVQGTYKDNVFLKPEYVDYLISLKGPLGKAWRDGDWTAFEGMAFTDWNESKHVVPAFDIPDYWPRWMGIDWGKAAPFCALWLTKDPDIGRIYVYRELYQANLTDRQQATLIRELTPAGEIVRFRYADPSMWKRKDWEGQTSTTAAEYQKYGSRLTKGDNDRLSGKRKVDRLLGDLPDGKPGIQVFEECTNLIRTLPALPLATTGSGQVKEDVDTNTDDHPYDALKYGLSNVERQKVEKKDEAKTESPMAELLKSSTRL